MTVAQRHYIGKSDVYLRTVVDDAFAPAAAMLVRTPAVPARPCEAQPSVIEAAAG